MKPLQMVIAIDVLYVYGCI